jgi:hypothetical protein
MQETYRCPQCNRELPTLAAVREHVNKDHTGAPAGKAESEPLERDGLRAGENSDEPGLTSREGRPPERALLTEEEEEAVEEQEVAAVEEDIERNKVRLTLEAQKWD